MELTGEEEWNIEAIGNSIVHLSKEYKNKSENLLNPYREDLQRIVETIREDVDRSFMGSLNFEKPIYQVYQGIMADYAYPEGWCCEIRDEVLKRLKKEIEISDEPSLKSLLQVHQEIIPIREAWGILNSTHGKVFQNFIQVGHLIIDGAYDTGKEREIRVVVSGLEEGILENINCYKEYYTVAEKYWHSRIYPTSLCFPCAAPFFPAFTVSCDGRIDIAGNRELFFKNILTGFKLSSTFLDSNPWKEKTPPLQTIKYLSKKYKYHNNLFKFDKTSPSLRPFFDFHKDYFKGVDNGKMTDGEKKNLLKVGRNLYKYAQDIGFSSAWHFF